ncbi:MAG: TylF/MycF/NovP-related O-methyltransferase [Candidatus Heimdallarchaeaceae archaeon]
MIRRKKQRVLERAVSLVDNSLKDVIEFGVYKGDTISYIRSLFDLSFRVFGFDSFIGLPHSWRGGDDKEILVSTRQGLAIKGLFDMKGTVPKVGGIEFYKGWFKETIPKYLKVAKLIGFVHIDCDLYSSTFDALSGVNDFIVPGTIILFDEWIYRQKHKGGIVEIDEEKNACIEWARKYDRIYSSEGSFGKHSCKNIIKIIR